METCVRSTSRILGKLELAVIPFHFVKRGGRLESHGMKSAQRLVWEGIRRPNHAYRLVHPLSNHHRRRLFSDKVYKTRLCGHAPLFRSQSGRTGSDFRVQQPRLTRQESGVTSSVIPEPTTLEGRRIRRYRVALPASMLPSVRSIRRKWPIPEMRTDDRSLGRAPSPHLFP